MSAPTTEQVATVTRMLTACANDRNPCWCDEHRSLMDAGATCSRFAHAVDALARRDRERDIHQLCGIYRAMTQETA